MFADRVLQGAADIQSPPPTTWFSVEAMHLRKCPTPLYSSGPAPFRGPEATDGVPAAGTC